MTAVGAAFFVGRVARYAVLWFVYSRDWPPEGVVAVAVATACLALVDTDLYVQRRRKT